MKKFLFFSLIALIGTEAIANTPKIKTTLNKTSLKTNESFSLSYYLINDKNRRIHPPFGVVSLNYYTDSQCTQNQSFLGQNINLSEENSGNYSFSQAGTFYIKPSIVGYAGSCLGPITVFPSQNSFEKLSLSKSNQTSNSVQLQLRWENNQGSLSVESKERASVSFYTNSSCLGSRIPRTRVYSVTPKNGFYLLSLVRPNSPTVYACASSGQIRSSLLITEYSGSPQSCPTNYHTDSGSCVPDSCTTADVSNSTAVSGTKVSGCQATSCATSYLPSSGDCLPDFDHDGFISSSFGGTDCNDSLSQINPGSQEVCDGNVDNDCDGLADDQDTSTSSSSKTTWYYSSDKTITQLSCNKPNGFTNCSQGYHSGSGGSCTADIQSCPVSHGTGTMSYNESTHSFSQCAIAYCDSGYSLFSGKCSPLADSGTPAENTLVVDGEQLRAYIPTNSVYYGINKYNQNGTLDQNFWPENYGPPYSDPDNFFYDISNDTTLLPTYYYTANYITNIDKSLILKSGEYIIGIQNYSYIDDSVHAGAMAYVMILHQDPETKDLKSEYSSGFFTSARTDYGSVPGYSMQPNEILTSVSTDEQYFTATFEYEMCLIFGDQNCDFNNKLAQILSQDLLGFPNKVISATTQQNDGKLLFLEIVRNSPQDNGLFHLKLTRFTVSSSTLNTFPPQYNNIIKDNTFSADLSLYVPNNDFGAGYTFNRKTTDSGYAVNNLSDSTVTSNSDGTISIKGSGIKDSIGPISEIKLNQSGTVISVTRPL